jgi:hypothetical protein
VLSSAARERLAEELGGVLAALHALREQRSCGALARADTGSPAPSCVAVRDDGSEPPRRDHARARAREPGAEGYTLSGLVDFEPSMLSAPEYEFAARAQCGAFENAFSFTDCSSRSRNFRWYIERLALRP